ncbi:23S rRNA methyltransferase [candidate division MSBL1 archaeon SCGC-AAA259E19]|uniref:Ribosomal RNA large subunit methyltransferase E n=1 Tax=candidate division MSBL1 archaeon SCGC-AAA259E19 TaxID=1698264 RepID=A0A133UDF9_9EURY|nr:23S rRNA methyltransferase [candidate division MSBL1 archaeon SCGC-AAA259E19]
MGKRWQEKRKNEHYYKKAKKEGYRSRAAYKLKQLHEKYDLLAKDDVTVDLGAAPGGWLQVAREKVGREGFVLGIDLEPIEELDYENVKTIQADITEEGIEELILKNLPRRPKVILSDASPNISGVWEVDHARSVDLGRSALSLAQELFDHEGNILIKVFQGKFFEELKREARKDFDFLKASKPEASRKRSAEIYLIGKGFIRD